MTDAIVINYYDSKWDIPHKIVDDVKRNYERVTGYDVNHVQMELYE